jgi:hypothetical protein
MRLDRKDSLLFAAVLAVVCAVAPAQGGAPPPWLPCYDLTVDLDVCQHVAHVQMLATWTNYHQHPTRQLVFNAHSRFVLPSDKVPLTAKTLELLRVQPSEALTENDPACEVHRVFLPGPPGAPPAELPWHFEGETGTTLVVELPRPIATGESVTVRMELTMHLPQKQGRWGQWRGITYLTNWLPVFAYYDDCPPRTVAQQDAPVPVRQGFDPGWQPTPFVPWHQPWFNEAAHYHAVVHLPAGQKVACSGTIVSCKAQGNGLQEVEIQARAVRDFALLCSSLYQEWQGEVVVCTDRPPVRIHVLALPQHEFYAKEMLRITREALETYSKWFGAYPYPDFTLVESYFGWLGNECGTLVMVDERVFNMPHLAVNYIEYLVSHEICHQWWYNAVGTNGYCETFMDEALAVFFTHHLLNKKFGRNNKLMAYPRGLEWLPNIHREDYRSYGMYGTFGRGEDGPIMQDMPSFGHIVTLFSLCYDKGARVIGMIEERLGEAAFFDFMRLVFCKYQFRILRVADFQRELEAYTGKSWEEFFQHWLYHGGMSDWAVDNVVVEPPSSAAEPRWWVKFRCKAAGPPALDNPQGLTRVTVFLEQRAEYNEQTYLGIAMPGCQGYPIRIPILPQAGSYHFDNPPTSFQTLGPNRFRVEVLLTGEPTQIAVDPDQVLVDKNPANNFWKPPIRWRLTPLYTFLDETDLTNAYDRWNVIMGPWIYGTAYDSPWYTRSMMLGARAGVYRTQEFDGGVYAAYRTDFRDVVVGADGLISHWPDDHFEVGFNIEQRLASQYSNTDDNPFRAVVFGRKIFKYSSSLYLPPMEYLDVFAAYQDNFMPVAKLSSASEGERFHHTSTLGLHYQVNYLTPYWDPEAGFFFDVQYQGGVAELEKYQGLNEITSQFSVVKSLPNLTCYLNGMPAVQDTLRPFLDWLGDSRLALRIFGAAGMPSRGQLFTMGGSEMFRGYDLSQRQGSAVWVGSVEWRMPIARGLTWDCCDHILGVRNVYGALFYDVGNAYTNEKPDGPLAHALGGGLRVDTSFFGFVERAVLRLDVAKTINDNTPVQFWVGVLQPF